MDTVAQWAILFLGPAAVWIMGRSGKSRRWGYVIGMAA